VIAIDTNLLVYAHRRDSPFHSAASVCLQRLAEGHAAWSIPWPCVFEFWNVATHPRILSPPSTPEQTLAQLEAWLASPTCRLLGDMPTQRPALRQLVSGAIRGPLVHDARIALICQAHGIDELWSVDRDFSRFTWMKTRNPLIAGG